MNTIVASRAGKDLISSLASGLLTIGSRFGGALDEAAVMFSNARDTGLTPREFVDNSRKANKLISGIGHKIKSVNNPDLRVELVKEYVQKNFPSHSLLDYALAVEKVTTAKKDTVGDVHSYYLHPTDADVREADPERRRMYRGLLR